LRPEDYHDLKKKISCYEFQKALAIVDKLKQDFSGKFIK